MSAETPKICQLSWIPDLHLGTRLTDSKRILRNSLLLFVPASQGKIGKFEKIWSGSMVGFGEVVGTAKVLIEGRKLLRELSQANLSDKHQALVNQTLEIVTDAQERLSVLQGTIIDLQQENESLRAKLRNAEDWQSRLARFERTCTRAGGVVWREIDSDPPIYACPRCVESDAELHILQPLANGYFGCSKCDKSYAVELSSLDRQRQVISRGID